MQAGGPNLESPHREGNRSLMAHILPRAVSGAPSASVGVVQGVLRFHGFEMRPAQRQVWVDGRQTVIGARAFDVLLALLESNGRLMTRHELLKAGWPGLVVEENNLSVQISTLRKVLGEGAVSTIPGRGYRWSATRLEATESAPKSVANPVGMRTNLPTSMQSLIGRDDDIEAVAALLPEHRLVTITGAGGIGKTRLAERMLHEQREAFSHGVGWVDLAVLTDGALICSTIAGALDLQMRAGDPLESLGTALAPLEILVALDNAEHLIDDVARVVVALMDCAPRVRVLVTSQVPLRLAGECVYRLGPLAVPDADTPMEDAMDYGAVRLFVECARAADRRFEVTPQLLPGILRICAQLDGVALSIELAAARVAMLGIARLAALLDERLSVLTQGRRDAPARQRTLRAALEWSHSLLGEAEVVVFRRLGVFVGGATLEAAIEVARDEGPSDKWAVFDALGSLVDRSLVHVDGIETPRYRLLESARALALDRLSSSGEEQVVRSRHAHAITRRFAQVTADSLQGRRGVDESLRMLDPDLDNARAALSFFLCHSDPLGAVSLAPALSFALTIARHAERSNLWEQVMPLLIDDMPVAVRAAFEAACSGHWYWRKPAEAVPRARSAVALYRSLSDAPGLYRALGLLGMATARAGMQDESAQACAELRALEKTHHFSPRLRLMASVAHLGLADRLGQVDEMQRILNEQLVLSRAAGDSANENNGLSTLIDTELVAGRIADAVDHGRELESKLRGTRHLSALAFSRVGLVGALVANGEFEQAHQMTQMAWPLAVQFDIHFPLADNLALLAALEGRDSDAAQLLGYADAGNAATGLERQLGESRVVKQTVDLVSGRLGAESFALLRARGARLSLREAASLLGVDEQRDEALEVVRKKT